MDRWLLWETRLGRLCVLRGKWGKDRNWAPAPVLEAVEGGGDSERSETVLAWRFTIHRLGL